MLPVEAQYVSGTLRIYTLDASENKMSSGMEPVKQSWPMGMLDHHDMEEDDIQQEHPEQQYVKRARKKLRDSCNSCALSKVKCSRDRPSCERCEDRGIYCRYSPSRRTGKRRMQPTIQSSSGSLPQPHSLGMITPMEEPLSYDFDNFDFTNSSDRAVGNANAQNTQDVHHSLKTPTLDNPLMQWDESLFAMIMDDVENDGSDNFDYLSHNMMAPNQTKNHDNSSRSNDSYSAPASKSSDGSAFSEVDQPDSHEKVSEPSSLEGLKSLFDILQQGPNNTSTINPKTPSCPSASTSNASATGVPRDCMSIALDALQSLHRPHTACTMAFNGHPTSQTRSPTLEIDHVLAKNKEIIDSVAKTLKCSCSLDTQLALILTVIGFKIIAWYSAVARGDEEQDASPQSGSTNRACKPTAERVSHMPITVGKYNLDGVDKRKMHAQIALSELHRVVRLIEQLGKSFRQVGQDTNMDGMDACGDTRMDTSTREAQTSSPSIGGVLVSFLRDRVQSATNETMGILKESQQL